MKAYVRWPLLIIAFAVLLLLLLSLFYLNLDANEKLVSQGSVPQSQVVNKASPGSPVRLKIPRINVDAAIEYVGITSKGVMEVPNNTADVGWFDPGPRPGEKGSAVITGHFNGKDGKDGVFNNLHKLEKGDKLYIKDGKGTSITFAVREKRTYDPGYAEEVFSLNDSAHLNLITCDGVWDGTKKSYSKRLVVFADITD